MSTSEKLTIRRRTAKPAAPIAEVAQASAPSAASEALAKEAQEASKSMQVEQQPQETPAPAQAEAPKANISKATQTAKAAQEEQDALDNAEIAIPSFFQNPGNVRKVDLRDYKDYKPTPIKAALVIDNPNFKEDAAPEEAPYVAPELPTDPITGALHTAETSLHASFPEDESKAEAAVEAEEEHQEAPVNDGKQRSKNFGERVEVNKLDESLAASLASRRPGQKKINEKQFFSEGHKESVIKNNDFVENNQTKKTVYDIQDNTAFLELIKKGESAVEIVEGDNEYAQAASRSVIATISSYYSVVLLHSGYQANFTGLKYLGKSRLLTSAESLYLDRRRLYETIYNQIESMTGGKPSFEKWLKITSFHDTASLLFGVYAATFPTTQTFEVTCPKCGNKMQVPTDPESIVAVYDKDAYERVRDIVNANPTQKEIFEKSALAKIEILPMERRQSVFYIKEPSIQDFLDILAVVTREPELYTKYEDTFEKTMYIDHIMIPDTAHYQREGKVRFVKITDKKLIVRFIANLEDDEGQALDDTIDKLNTAYDVSYEIPEFTCNGLLKNENGDWTDEPCKQKIEAMHLDMEKILFHYLQRKPGQPKEQTESK